MHPRLIFFSLMLAVVTPSIALIHQAELPVLAQGVPPISEKANADRLFNEGVQQYRLGQYPQALSTYQRVLEIRKQQGDKAGIGQTLNNIGEVYLGLEQYDKALEVWQPALAIRQELKDRTGEGETLDNIGFAYEFQGPQDKALKSLQQALVIRREVKDRIGEGKTLSRIGAYYFDSNQYTQGLSILNQALAIQETEDKFQAAFTLRRIAGAYIGLKDYPHALEFAQKALSWNRELKNRAQEAKTLRSIAFIYSFQNKYDLQLQILSQAQPIFRECGLYSQEVEILSQISGIYSIQNNKERALEIRQQALVLARSKQLLPQQLNLLNWLAVLHNEKIASYIASGLHSQAKSESSQVIELSQEALSLARVLKNRKLEADSLDNLGYAYSILNEPQKAIELLQQSLSIAREIKNLDVESSALGHLGSIYLYQNKTKKQLEVKLRELEIARAQNKKIIEAGNLIELANIYFVKGENLKAIDTYKQAISVAQQIDISNLAPNLKDEPLRVKCYALQQLSFVYKQNGQYDKAIDYAQQALKYAQTVHNPELEATALLKLGFLYTNTFKDFPKAIALNQQALTIARQIKEASLEADALEGLSYAYNKQGNPQQALEFANQLLAIAKVLGNPQLESTALDALENIYQKQGNYQKAMATVQERLVVLRKANLPIFEIYALVHISQNYLLLGDTVQALEIGTQALKLSQESKKPGDEVLALNQISLIYQYQGKYEQGIQTAENALAISKKNNIFQSEVSATITLSAIYNALGEFQKVIAIAEPNLTAARKINDRAGEGQLLINLGNAYRLIGDYPKAKDLIEQGLKIARDLKDPRLESIALNSLGNYYYISGKNYQQALLLTQQSLQIAQSLKSPPLLIYPQFTLGDIYSNLGDYKKSREFYQQALTTAQQLKNRQSEGIALFAQGYTYFSQGEPQKTVELSQKALSIFQEIKIPRLEAFATRALSVGYGELGDDAKAVSAAQSFLVFTRKTQNSVWEKDALSLLASLHSKFGRKDQAIATYQQALAIKTQTDTDAYNYAGLARIYRDLNQPSVAIKYYKESINKIQEFRHSIEGLPPELQNSFLESTVDLNHTKVSDIYRQLAELLLSQHRDKEAFQVQQLIRNQELREATGYRSTADKPNIPLTANDAKIPTQSPSIIALARQIDECKRTNCPQSSELEQRKTKAIKDFTQHLGEIDKEIRANRASDDGFFDPKELGKAQNIVEAEPNTVMIYPLVLEKEMWIQLYGAKGVVKTLKIPVSREELGKTVKEFRNLMEYCQKTTCGVDETAKVKVVSQKLYNWLIKDLEPELQSNQVKNLVFALDRETRYIPMSTLYDGKQYLIEKYSIHNVLNQDYDKNARLPVGIQNTQILAMGLSNAVSKPHLNFRALNNVPAELDAIVKTNTNQGIFPGQKYLNTAFDLPTLQRSLEGHKVLHLATHGVFDPTNPKESFILLGNGNELKPDDITTLTGLSDINLVVLSACQTALADRQQQDGIEINTLAFYFINRGAKSVMASLWEVNDGSTTTLMQQFYRNLAKATKQTPITKAEALRQAQLTLLRGQTTATDQAHRSPELPTVIPIRPDTPTRKDTTKDPSHPYYWAPFILLGNGL